VCHRCCYRCCCIDTDRVGAWLTHATSLHHHRAVGVYLLRTTILFYFILLFLYSVAVVVVVGWNYRIHYPIQKHTHSSNHNHNHHNHNTTTLPRHWLGWINVAICRPISASRSLRDSRTESRQVTGTLVLTQQAMPAATVVLAAPVAARSRLQTPRHHRHQHHRYLLLPLQLAAIQSCCHQHTPIAPTTMAMAAITVGESRPLVSITSRHRIPHRCR
jgi:hypothetical protein